jgi:hypothetical protein
MTRNHASTQPQSQKVAGSNSISGTTVEETWLDLVFQISIATVVELLSILRGVQAVRKAFNAMQSPVNFLFGF